MYSSNGLVEDAKAKTNFLVPAPLLAAFREIAVRYGSKRHWTVFSAAILAVLEMDRETLEFYAQEVGSADYGRCSWQDLIERAKSGKLRKQAFAWHAGAPAQRKAALHKGRRGGTAADGGGESNG